MLEEQDIHHSREYGAQQADISPPRAEVDRGNKSGAQNIHDYCCEYPFVINSVMHSFSPPSHTGSATLPRVQ